MPYFVSTDKTTFVENLNFKETIMKFIRKYPLAAFMSITLTLWLALLITGIIIPDGAKKVSLLAANIEFCVHAITLALLGYLIFRYISKSNKKLFLWLLSITFILMVVDLLYYLAAYANETYLQNMHIISFLFYYFPCIIYCIVMIIFLSKVLLKHVLSNKSFLKIMLALVIFNIIVLSLYLPNIHYAYKVISWETMSQVAMISIELVMFDFAVLGIIFSNTVTATLFLAGTIQLITGDFLLTYSYTTQTVGLYSYGELFWLLGLMFIFYSILNMFINKDYDINKWFQQIYTIRTRIVFWSFGLSLLGFLVFFIVAYAFSLVDRGVFVELPLFTLIYSIIFVILSSYIGKAFESPFLKLQKIISDFGTNTPVNKIEFNIKEFDYLQDSIVCAFRYKAERDKFSILVAEVAHDLKSPVMALNFAVKKIKNDENINEAVLLKLKEVDKLIKEIKNISSNILTSYYELTDNSDPSIPMNILSDDGNLPRFLNIFNLLEDIISSKKSECASNPCDLNLKADNFFKENLVYIAPTKIIRILSNILNNSYQSLCTEIRNINVYLKYINNEYFTLIVEDSGCGISKEKINEVLAGKSSKHSGKGIGLSSAVSYLKSIHGDLSINSEVNNGTSIKITIPLLPQPEWLNEKIEFNKNTIFAVLDDDPQIILTWQKIFSRIGVKCVYFLTGNELLEWYKDNKDKEIILFSDYDLKSDLTGLEIIDKMSINKAYIVTNHAEEYWLQEKIKSTNIKLILKSRVNNLQIVKAEPNSRKIL